MEWKVGDKFKYKEKIFEIADIDKLDVMIAKELHRMGYFTLFGLKWQERIKPLNVELIREKLGVK